MSVVIAGCGDLGTEIGLRLAGHPARADRLGALFRA